MAHLEVSGPDGYSKENPCGEWWILVNHSIMLVNGYCVFFLDPVKHAGEWKSMALLVVLSGGCIILVKGKIWKANRD